MPTFAVVIMNASIDNDMWGVLANGRWIAENGIYYTDVLSMHDGLDITVQNWLFALGAYKVFTIFGLAGIYAGMLILNFLILFFLYKICMLLSRKNENLSLILMVVTDILMALGFIVTREQMFSYVVILAAIYVMELFIQSGKAKYLMSIPLMGLLMINVRASTWVLILVLMFIYIIDGVKWPMLHLQGYKIKPLIMVVVLTFLVGFINPYGIKMMGFLSTSYSARFFDLIIELNPFNPMLGNGPVYWLGIMIVMILYIFGKNKSIRVRHLALFFMFLTMGLVARKEIGELILVMFFPMALVYKDWQMPRLVESELVRRAFVMWAGVFAAVLGSVAVVAGMVLIDDRPREELAAAVDAIDEDAVADEKRDLKIYTGYNDGGYLEYRGYRTYLDPRGEVFLKSNNGKEDILDEWIDLGEGKIKVEEFVDKYDFDYIVAEEDEKLYEMESGEYELIYDNEVRVYRKS